MSGFGRQTLFGMAVLAATGVPYALTNIDGQAEQQSGAVDRQLSLDVDPEYIKLIPSNVIADVQATTVFGNKYVSFRSPEDEEWARA